MRPCACASAGPRSTAVATVHNAEAVAPARVPVLFEPFRSSGRGRARGVGLGLGLYISRAIVEAHGEVDRRHRQRGRGDHVHGMLPRQARR